VSPNEIALIVFAVTFGGAILGISIRGRLPEHHLSSDSRDVVKLVVGTIATLSALVLGLLIASAKSSFNTKDAEIKEFSANIILLDRQLVHYGPEAQGIRELLRRYTNYKIDATWSPKGSTAPADPNGWTLLEDLQDRVRELAPETSAKRALQARALQIGGELAKARWLLGLQTGSSISEAFLWVLVFWLAVIFTSFGLLTPPNPTVLAALLVGALSVSGAIFLIVELDSPFDGLIQVSSQPMREALAHLQ
jgi:hypothetical protein